MKQTANAAYMIFSFKERIHDEQKRKEKKAQVFKIREKTEDGMTSKNLQELKFGGGGDTMTALYVQDVRFFVYSTLRLLSHLAASLVNKPGGCSESAFLIIRWLLNNIPGKQPGPGILQSAPPCATLVRAHAAVWPRLHPEGGASRQPLLPPPRCAAC